jgi:putative membrane protein
LAGVVATVPMTLWMLLIQQLLPRWQQYALPPEILTDELLERTGVKIVRKKPFRVGAALLAHFGYGTAVGTIYPLLKRRRIPASLQGMVFGLLVWAINYLGLLPVLRIGPSAPREPLRRNLLMIVAHLIWGAALGLTERGVSQVNAAKRSD